MGSSIVFSDSIPLLAIGLKPLSRVLPQDFQYSGWWIIAAFALSGAFGWRIGWVATQSRFGAVASATFAVLSPVMLDRATGHYALMAHWLILWSILNYLRPPRSVLATGMPLWVAALTHAYLLLMILVVWCAEQARYAHARRVTARRARVVSLSVRCVAVWLVLGMVLLAAGYFELAGGSLGGDLYGTFALNLNGLLNPVWGSRFLPGMPTRKGATFEGFAYLGVGAILLGALGTIVMLSSQRARSDMPRLAPILVGALLLACIALSHEIYLDDELFLRIALPQMVLMKLGVFRASGRLAWVLYYCVVLGGVAAPLRYLPQRLGLSIVAVALALQIADLGPRFDEMRQFFAARYERGEGLEEPALKAAEWPEIATRYRRVHVVPMENAAPNYFRLGLFAAVHEMSINVGYFSRVGDLQLERDALLSRVRSGDWEPDTVYVVNSPALLPEIRRGEADALMSCDGMWVIAPGWLR